MGDDQKEMKKRLKVLMNLPENATCSDCPERQPRWASLIVPPPGAPPGSLPIGAFCCLECSGSHRRLGVHISFVRSITLDSWKEKEVLAMENGGNAKVNAIFEARLAGSGVTKPHNHADGPTRERFIRDKYERRKFYDAAKFEEFAQRQQQQPQRVEQAPVAQQSQQQPVGPPSEAARARMEARKSGLRKSASTASGDRKNSSHRRKNSPARSPVRGPPRRVRSIEGKAPNSAPLPDSLDLLDLSSDQQGPIGGPSRAFSKIFSSTDQLTISTENDLMDFSTLDVPSSGGSVATEPPGRGPPPSSGGSVATEPGRTTPSRSSSGKRAPRSKKSPGAGGTQQKNATDDIMALYSNPQPQQHRNSWNAFGTGMPGASTNGTATNNANDVNANMAAMQGMMQQMHIQQQHQQNLIQQQQQQPMSNQSSVFQQQRAQQQQQHQAMMQQMIQMQQQMQTLMQQQIQQPNNMQQQQAMMQQMANNQQQVQAFNNMMMMQQQQPSNSMTMQQQQPQQLMNNNSSNMMGGGGSGGHLRPQTNLPSSSSKSGSRGRSKSPKPGGSTHRKKSPAKPKPDPFAQFGRNDFR